MIRGKGIRLMTGALIAVCVTAPLWARQASPGIAPAGSPAKPGASRSSAGQARAVPDERVAWPDPLVLASDVLCPYVCGENEKVDPVMPGASVEIARAMAAERGVRLDVRIWPWARSEAAARQGDVTGLLLIARAGDGEFVLTDQAVGLAETCFVKRVGDPWLYQGPDSLRGRRLGLIRDYKVRELSPYLAHNAGNPELVQWMTGQNALTRNLAKLLLKRVDMVMDDRVAMSEIMRKNDWVGRLAWAGCTGAVKLFPALAGRRPDAAALTKSMSETLRRLRAKGVLAAIWARYGLADPEAKAPKPAKAPEKGKGMVDAESPASFGG